MDWIEIVVNIIGDAINGVIVGIFTVIGVGITIRNERKKEKRQEEKEKHNNKPELIVNRYENKNEENIDMALLVAAFSVDKNINFEYSDKYKNKDEYISEDFVFQNIGKTAIETLYIVSTCKKNTSIFNVKYADTFMNHGAINYGCIWDRKIFPGDELKIKLYFHKDFIPSSTFIIQFDDSNGMCWQQTFFENDCKLYSPIKISYREYKENISLEIKL